MFDEEEAPNCNGDGSRGEGSCNTPVSARAIWSEQLDRGWHGVNVSDWAGLYLPAKLDADMPVSVAMSSSPISKSTAELLRM